MEQIIEPTIQEQSDLIPEIEEGNRILSEHILSKNFQSHIKTHWSDIFCVGFYGTNSQAVVERLIFCCSTQTFWV